MCLHRCLNRKNKISIPYGSIKRRYDELDMPEFIGFQFLMVRLKVDLEALVRTIPTIFQFLMVRLKAHSQILRLKHRILFQFLMVRLKELPPAACWPPQHEFQFLMVRLKAETMVVCTIHILNFNSLWFD